FERAIRYLRQALDLPRRQQREEHPSHLWNTLGTAFSRLAAFLDTVGSNDARQAWNDACEAFRKSIDLLPGNIEAILAFSRRLLGHAGAFDGQQLSAPTPTAVDDVAQAMSLLDEAEELIEQSQDPDLDRRAELTNYRTRGLDWLGRDLVSSY